MNTTEIYHFLQVDDQLVTAGQPTEDQLRAVAAEGFATVINLATLDSHNALPDEAGLARSLGMTYYHIPVQWDDPKDSDFDAFERVMLDLPAGKTLIHCAANFRVTAFYSLYAQKHLGWTRAQAEALRSAIWQGSDYPLWERFISRTQARVARQA